MEAKPGVFIDSLTSAERKQVAVSRGLFAYFPDALALVARHSVISNEKHNPGQPVHWSRGKSTDQEDCIARHSLSIAIDPNSLDDGQPHIVCRAWRALAALQLWAEAQQERATLPEPVLRPDGSNIVPDSGWAPWFGETSTPPVDGDKRLHVRFRDGTTRGTQVARDWYWRHDGCPSDIVAYKVL